jgi:hypothetical protein
MSRSEVKWIFLAVFVLGLLAGAHPIVEARNRVFHPAGQEAAVPFMH